MGCICKCTPLYAGGKTANCNKKNNICQLYDNSSCVSRLMWLLSVSTFCSIIHPITLKTDCRNLQQHGSRDALPLPLAGSYVVYSSVPFTHVVIPACLKMCVLNMLPVHMHVCVCLPRGIILILGTYRDTCCTKMLTMESEMRNTENKPLNPVGSVFLL